MHHAPTSQIRARSRTTQRCPIRALAPQHCRFIVVPIILSEVEATVLGPEEEPDAGQHEANADEAEEREDGFVGDGGWGCDAGAWVDRARDEVLCASREEDGFGREFGEV